MPTSPRDCSLDEAVFAVREGLERQRVPMPSVLYLMGTGVGLLPEHLHQAIELPLGEVEGVPELWRSEVLFAGRIGSLGVWLMEDLAGEPTALEPGEAWVRGFPVWLAASCGACVCLHTSAGSALGFEAGVRHAPEEDPAPEPGGFGFVRDHLNLSGTTPLTGLGGSALGPLFPDLSALHHLGLRRAALERADKLGLACSEVVAACTPGPALETPAERRLYARAGADVAVQSLATPLLAAAHAGLAALAIVAITDADEGPARVGGLVEAAAHAEPALEDLLLGLTEDLERAVAALIGRDDVL